MLPKRHRLTRSRDIVRVRRFGRSAGSPLLALYVLPGRNPLVRVGFSVSKKVGKATVRNQVKRRLREAVRPHLPAVRPGYDLLFVARPAAAGATFEQIGESVEYLVRRTRVLSHPAGAARNA
jgi:ribonuclease P protein component